MQALKAENAQLRGAVVAMQQRAADLELGRHRPLGESCTLRAVRASVCTPSSRVNCLLWSEQTSCAVVNMHPRSARPCAPGTQ